MKIQNKRVYITMIKKTASYLLILSIIFAAGCSSKLKPQLEGADFFYNRGMNLMNKKDYIKAIADFQTIVDSYQSSEIIDEAHFMLAEARYKNEEYLTAAFEYERVFTDYPTSKLSPEARYKRALCYFNESPRSELDQENTNLAIDDFRRFIDNFPDNALAKDANDKIAELQEKLAYKDYKNAELYRKLKKYDSAIIYFNSIEENYPKSVWIDDANYGKALCLIKLVKLDKARDILKEISASDNDKGLKRKASKKLSEVEKKLAKK
jgi:outer membrane protein assembly factor BamD